MLNVHYLINLIRHYVASTFVDVLHSPFVFKLQQTCIARQPNNPAYFKEIEQVRTLLKRDNRRIAYQDFGASSNSRTVKVKEIAHGHLKPARIARILSFIVNRYSYQTSIELGTSFGITTSYLAKGSTENSRIFTIEACQDVRNIALETFQKLGLTNKITSIQGTFDEQLQNVLNQTGKADLVFIDGNHSYEATLRYFNQLLPYLHNESVLIFDDIYWSKGMTKAWEEIKQSGQVKVTVDLFFVGLVYFRSEQVKQHFKLRVW